MAVKSSSATDPVKVIVNLEQVTYEKSTLSHRVNECRGCFPCLLMSTRVTLEPQHHLRGVASVPYNFPLYH